MQTHSVVTFTDGSAAAENAVSRAAELASRHGWTLILGFRAWAHGRRQALRPPSIPFHAQALAQRWNIDVSPLDWGMVQHRILERRTSAFWVVVDRASVSKLTAGPGHRLAGRFLHEVACPVLLVQRDHAVPYRRVLVSAGAGQASEMLAVSDTVAHLATELEWFRLPHAGCLRSGGLAHGDGFAHGHEWPPPGQPGAPAPALRHSEPWSIRRNRVLFHASSRDPVLPIVHQADHGRADLVITSCPPSGPLARLLGHTPALRLVRALASDLLLCPHGPLLQTASDARQRLLQLNLPARQRGNAGLEART